MLTVQHIKQVVSDYFRDKPVKRVYLFGSYARGEADENSDVDLLVDLDKTQKIGWIFFEWYQDLEETLNKKVDVVSSDGLSPRIAPFIETDKRLIYAQ